MNKFYFKRKSFTKQPAGQGLLEAMLAIGLILVGLGAVLSLTLRNISAVADSGQRIVAVNLAREAIDVVRGIRDSNWLAASNSGPSRLWDDKLVPDNSGQGARAVLNLPLLGPPATPVAFEIEFIDGRDVNDDSYKMYRDNVNHQWYQDTTALKATGFNRMIWLDPVCKTAGVLAGVVGCGDTDTKIGIRVQVQVAWNASGIFGSVSKRQLTVEEYLYNWR
ncbi:MAG: hypothetical protein WC575_00610 [Patescibacteria group bacterium]